MKNREKYLEELLNVACTGKKIAIDKRTMQIRSCEGLSCGHCLFSGCGDCDMKLAEWTESEYIENPVISKRDRAFLDYIGERAEWMTKDCNGEISVWTTKPKKSVNFCAWMDGLYNCLSMSNIDFPMVKWSDAEPWKIEDLKELEVVDEYE